MKIIGVVMCLVTLMCAHGCRQAANPALEQPWFVASGVNRDAPAKVGVVRRMDLLLAYYKSEFHAAYLDDLTAKHQAAVASGDKTLASQCEQTGARNQEIAHQQLAGTAPLDNILEAIAPLLPQIAEDSAVDVIYESGHYKGNAVTVDITDALIAKLPASPRWNESKW